MNKNLSAQLLGLTLLVLLPEFAHAQLQVKENFNGTGLSDTSKTWIALNGACLTASTSHTVFTPSNPTPGVIPGCVSGGTTFALSNGNSYYTSKSSILVGGQSGGPLPDASGNGVLRLTNGASSTSPMTSTNGNNETGAFILANPFPSNSGMNISFNTYTWGGNAYKFNNVGTGADGISFFLLDVAKYTSAAVTPSTVISVTKTGAFGGSLGYDCSPNKYSGAADSQSGDGIIGAYIGVGIDEYGNFINKTDNANYYETASPGQTPNTIGIRGGGNINFLSFPTSNGQPIGVNPGQGPLVQAQYICKYGYYTTSATGTNVQVNTPQNGTATLYAVTSATANAVAPTKTGTANITWVSAVDTSGGTYTTTTGTYPVMGVFDYPIIQYKTLASPIYNQEYIAAPQRNNAIGINYYINLTTAGLLSVSYSYNGGVYTPVLSNQNIVPAGQTLPANFLFGFTSGTGGGSNNHEISCFNAVQLTSASSSAGGNIPQNDRVQQGNQIYLASYNPLYWTGTVTATNLNVASDGTITIANTSVWDAGCALSGTTDCVNTGDTAVTKQPYRAIAAWNDGLAAGATTATSTPAAVAFTVANFANLSGNEQQMLNCGLPTGTSTCDALGPKRVGFMIDGNTGTGDSVPANTFRSRVSLLGDMINSSPVWVGPPASPFTSAMTDIIDSSDPMPEGATYVTFQNNVAALNGGVGRLNTLYVGANDGMVHGFAAGYGNVNSSTSAADNTGVEVFAFVPSLPLSSIHNTVSGGGELDFTNQLYAHNDYVDATPGTGDLYWPGANNPASIGTKWQTWLVGGLGGGGNLGGVIGGTVDQSTGTITAATANNGVGEIYAVNITNPITPANLSAGSGTTVAANVMGDWTSNSIVCDTTVGITDTCNLHMGNTYGTPTIRRLHSGHWAIIFGNGLNSASGTAGIFIIEVTGSGTKPTYVIHYIDTGAGTSSDPTGKGTVNGIAYAAPADFDGDHVTDFVYAGDVLGNVWRFDLTSTNPGSWGSPVKIFQASSATQLAPITTAVFANAVTYNGQSAMIINFGTGRQLQQTLTSAAGYAPSGQNLYGVWDWNMDAWNAKSTVANQYYSKAAGTGITSGLSNLTQQTLTAATNGYNVSNNNVCYGFMVNCTGTPSYSYGWYLTLNNAQEQFIYNPAMQAGYLYVNSVIPPDQVKMATTCTTLTATGYTYALDPANGTNTAQAAYNLNGVGTPFFVTTSGGNSNSYGITQTNNGTPAIWKLPPIATPPVPSTRLTWLELR